MYFKIYQDNVMQWRWTLYAANHRKVADSAESYWNKNDCLHGIGLVKLAGKAPVYDA